MPKVRIRQVRSGIGRKAEHQRTLRALGLHRIGDEVVRDDRPEIRGMLAKVSYLISVESAESPS